MEQSNLRVDYKSPVFIARFVLPQRKWYWFLFNFLNIFSQTYLCFYIKTLQSGIKMPAFFGYIILQESKLNSTLTKRFFFSFLCADLYLCRVTSKIVQAPIYSKNCRNVHFPEAISFKGLWVRVMTKSENKQQWKRLKRLLGYLIDKSFIFNRMEHPNFFTIMSYLKDPFSGRLIW